MSEPRVTATKTTFGHLSESFGEILKGKSPEELAMIPRIPEEIARAKIRLRKPLNEFKCAICRDAEFVHPWVSGKVDYTQFVPCECVRAEHEDKKRKSLIAYCEIPEKGREMTFDSFIITPSNKEAFNICLAIAKEQSEFNFITLMGHSNHGKTHLAIAICNHQLNEGKPAKYVYVPLLLEELKAAFKKDGDDSYMSRYNTFLNVPILFLDDLGTENPTSWAQEKLDTLVDYRLMHKLTTVITTNKPFDKLPFRIANRLKRDGKIIAITGPEFGGKK